MPRNTIWDRGREDDDYDHKDDDDDEVWEEPMGFEPDGPGTIYDEQGNTVYDPWFENQKVERVCTYCHAHFRGMPDHGVCDPCADRLEAGLEPRDPPEDEE